VSDALGATPWYLRLLRDESVVAERMAYLLSVSRYFAELLLSAPDAVALLADDESLQPRSRESLLGEMQSVVGRHELAEDAVAAVRAIRQRELIRISAADLLGMIDVVGVCAALSDVADATLECSLASVMQRFFWDRDPSLRISLIGLGRLGGRELNYGSDADVCFVYAPIAGNERAGSDALSIVSSLQSLLTVPANDPPFPLDLDLRPEGKHGAVARTLDSYAAYYQRWSLTWESQALLRARAVAGDAALGAAFISLIDGMRYPENGLTPEELRDIRRIKARVEAERLPRGADPHTHVKLGPGGISDVEWTVQLLQLQHAHGVASLRHPDTLSVLAALGESGLMYATEAQTLRNAWLEASRIRNAIALVNGIAADSIPTQPMPLRVVSFVLHVANGATLIENYRRTARRARGVMQKYVYGIDE